MLSRVAESLYWMSRYLERAENVARYINVNLQLMCDQPGDNEQWEPFIVASGDYDIFTLTHGEATRDNVLHFLTFEERNPNSILNCLSRARENARHIREIISSEMWEQINMFYFSIREAAQRGPSEFTTHKLFTHVINSHHLFKGVTDASMSHGEGWHFSRMGQLIERADKTSRILDLKYFILLPNVDDVGSAYDAVQWGALLKSASALEMYRKRYHLIDPVHVAEFLMLDREFPRAIRYCLIKAAESLGAITGSTYGSFRNVAEQRLGKLRTEFDYMRIDEVFTAGLHEFLDRFQSRLNEVGDAIYLTFFSPAERGEPRRQFALAG